MKKPCNPKRYSSVTIVMVPARSRLLAIPEAPSAHYGSFWPPRNYSSLLAEARLARRKSLVLVRRELRRRVSSPTDAVIVCGDFNIQPAHLRRSGFLGRDLDPDPGLPLILKDAAESSIRNRDRDAPTFRGFGKSAFFQRRLDYCLYSTHLTCTHYALVDPVLRDRWLSDHRLVVTTFA